MSLQLLKTSLSKVVDCTTWSLQLLIITVSKKNGARYASRQIELSPTEKLQGLISEIASRYINDNGGELQHYTSVTEYDGTADGLTIYKLLHDNPLISEELSSLLEAVANPDVESDPLDFNPQAYILKGVIDMENLRMLVSNYCLFSSRASNPAFF